MTATRRPPHSPPSPPSSPPPSPPSNASSTRRGPWLAAGAVLVAVVLWGGYSHRWRWTGINGHTATLWDWLHLLLLPLAVAGLPLWLSHRTRVRTPHRSAAAAALGALALVVALGYLIPWAWTGFVGNTLWDWLNLVALPVSIGLVPVYRDVHAHWTRRHTGLAAAALVALVIAVIGGYFAGWSWTGFDGNTLWDWLHLLLLPLLVPTVIVPSLRPLLAAAVIVIEADSSDDGGHADGG